jgi:IclR family mhp operon transcriptional activator
VQHFPESFSRSEIRSAHIGQCGATAGTEEARVRDYRVKPIHALARGLEVLRVLGDMRAASLHDLFLATGIPKSTLTRILYTAHQQGLVWQRMVDGAFLPSHTLQRRRELDDADWIAEIASPALEELSRRVQWPSVLSVPRLDFMEVIETNTSRSYFDDVPVGATPYRANMLRSASGRAYLSFCRDQERDAVLRRLRERNVAGHTAAHDPAGIDALVRTTRARGYSVRAEDFGGDYDLPREQHDDGRDSIAIPIRVEGNVLGCLNLTWRYRVATVTQVVDRYLDDLRAAVLAVERRAGEVALPPR